MYTDDVEARPQMMNRPAVDPAKLPAKLNPSGRPYSEGVETQVMPIADTPADRRDGRQVVDYMVPDIDHADPLQPLEGQPLAATMDTAKRVLGRESILTTVETPDNGGWVRLVSGRGVMRQCRVWVHVSPGVANLPVMDVAIGQAPPAVGLGPTAVNVRNGDFVRVVSLDYGGATSAVELDTALAVWVKVHQAGANSAVSCVERFR